MPCTVHLLVQSSIALFIWEASYFTFNFDSFPVYRILG